MKNRRCCTTAALALSKQLVPGMIFTVEPMINAGRREIRELADGWTIVTKDHSLSAQWEHTVLVTESGFRSFDCVSRSACQAGTRCCLSLMAD